MLYKKNIKWLTVGDIIAEDIYDGETLILKAGTILTMGSIIDIQTTGMEYVLVKQVPTTNKGNKIIDNSIKQAFTVEYLNEVFYEFLLKAGKSGRYHSILSSDDNYHFINDLFTSIMAKETVENIMSALKIWDMYSYEHSLDVFIIGSLWGKQLELSNIQEIATGFLLHDIGKIKIPRDILQKKGKLTFAEFEKVKKHPIYGAQLLCKLGFSEQICHLAKFHHLRVDGTGYPNNQPERLSKEVKMLMITDVFSALTLDRPYRKAFSTQDALEILISDKILFDKELLTSFTEFVYPDYSYIL
ncbi:HD-GYP domain-containing protein [Bacillus kwashiorkori]|uniref:HD-GYP domain-containing protein n=1 Tax=Bacillus kwashiorkori TaxID=1522318 RepID=UPI0007838DDB|nr:HD domain-containing phosphohydrolase [Bacillus kwashiorkori]